MNPYTILSSGLGAQEATDLSARLSAWHDAMVAHERRLRSGQTTDACDDECPHVEARTLWAEVSALVGPRASELTFLRSRAQDASAASDSLSTSARLSRSAGRRPVQASRRPSESFIDSSDPSQRATAEL